MKQNDDVRKISAWVAIVAVPTAVTGFFGQNVPYPGFGTDTGLGLAIVKGVVEAHHGRVEVKNVDNSLGCRFAVILP